MIITYRSAHVSEIIAGNDTEIQWIEVFENFFLVNFRATPKAGQYDGGLGARLPHLRVPAVHVLHARLAVHLDGGAARRAA